MCNNQFLISISFKQTTNVVKLILLSVKVYLYKSCHCNPVSSVNKTDSLCHNYSKKRTASGIGQINKNSVYLPNMKFLRNFYTFFQHKICTIELSLFTLKINIFQRGQTLKHNMTTKFCNCVKKMSRFNQSSLLLFSTMGWQ